MPRAKATKSKTVKPEKEAWTDTHDLALLHALTAQLLATRRDIYAAPELSGVADHGGERINKKIQAAIKRMCGEYSAVLGEEMAKMKGARGQGGSSGNRGVRSKREETDLQEGRSVVKIKTEKEARGSGSSGQDTPEVVTPSSDSAERSDFEVNDTKPRRCRRTVPYVLLP